MRDVAARSSDRISCYPVTGDIEFESCIVVSIRLLLSTLIPRYCLALSCLVCCVGISLRSCVGTRTI
jgi:hypothetical protein